MALSGDDGRRLSRKLIDTYFRTNAYPYTRHHIDSYDQFMQQDLINIVQSQNPILILKDLVDETTNTYKYRVEIFVGGADGSAIEIGTPTVTLQNGEEIRMLYPNEARLRNLTYASTVYADIHVSIAYVTPGGETVQLFGDQPYVLKKWQLFKMPIMLHSKYCILHNKPKEFLREVGECPYDNGGYFIVDGAEKVLITRQEQAFNTLYITPQTSQNDPKVAVYASIQCLSSKTRQVKRVAIALMRHVERKSLKSDKIITSYATIEVSLPFVRKAIPLFVLFRALGFQSDEEILKMIFPDFNSPEAKFLLPKLQPCIIDAYPFTNSYLAIQFIKTLTKGFSTEHVLDIIKNQLFIHMPNDSGSQGLFLGDCVRRILRVSEDYDDKTDRDDTRNQRCLTSGFLVQELFINSYKLWIKAFVLEIGKEYNYNKTLYSNENFKDIFQPGNENKVFLAGLLNDMIMKGFKGKWGTGLGEEKSGVLQALSRLSYTDFMSHCRRVILDFDTGMKLTGPRKLHTSQFGYFCTSETPTGASIGITKNMSIMTAISTASQTDAFFKWLRVTGHVYSAEQITLEQRIEFVPVYTNGGMFGYTAKPGLLTSVLKMLKRSGCLPYSVSITFSIRDRKVYIYMDAGRPLRPLVWLDHAKLPIEKLDKFPTWRDLVMGSLAIRKYAGLDSTDFLDPLEDKSAKLDDYLELLQPHTGAVEYVDPYEQNECFIANNPAYIRPETTHMEVHPSTIMSMMTSLIPFAPHNQSPRNQLSCSQSKQGVSIYATNWRNRFDNTAHVLCYGEMPITRTMYNNYLGEGRMAYGMNCVLAIACWSGYNQEDGIVMNYDAVHRGMFRSMAFRSYEAFEEDDEKAGVKVRFGNPAEIAEWKDLKPGLDYSKLDERGIIKEGAYVDETTVIVGAFMMSNTGGNFKDASTTPQVWTKGRVEKVAVMVNNLGLRLVKIRVVQDRIPELGDKFSNRHGQKGTIGALLRGHDMPRTESGIVPDMIMNPHAIPSRMTIAQNLEQLLGKTAAVSGAIGDGTSFMNDGSPQEVIGHILENLGFEKYGNEVMYNGATGEQIPAAIFVGPVYGMRLKHMVEDKWNARGQGRKEARTHQPTGGRGAQGGLKIGEMDRDAIIAHAGMAFVKESYMERSDGTTIPLCVACGMVPIFNPRLNLAICSMCDGPVKYIGNTIHNMELLPPVGRPKSKIVQVEMPYSTKLLTHEQETYLNLAMRYITTNGFQKLKSLELSGTATEMIKELPRLILPETVVPAYIEEAAKPVFTIEQLRSMGAVVNQLTEAEQAALDTIAEEQVDEFGQPIEVAPSMQSMGQPMGQSMGQMPPMSFPQGQNEVIYPQLEQSMLGGMQLPGAEPTIITGQMQQPLQPSIPSIGFAQGGDGIVAGAAMPGMGGMIVVDTSPMRMAQDGIDPGMPMGGRRPRRNPYHGGFGSFNRGAGMDPMMMQGGEEPMPPMPSMPSSNSGAAIRVNKME
uniref:DNA-directed RNA polymerase n=1 Tax=viral metagenome TaxID=1070528 RepID=A0A6C0KT75_9ZZZZ